MPPSVGSSLGHKAAAQATHHRHTPASQTAALQSQEELQAARLQPLSNQESMFQGKAEDKVADFVTARQEEMAWLKNRAMQSITEADPLWLARGFSKHAHITLHSMANTGSKLNRAPSMVLEWCRSGGKGNDDGGKG